MLGWTHTHTHTHTLINSTQSSQLHLVTSHAIGNWNHFGKLLLFTPQPIHVCCVSAVLTEVLPVSEMLISLFLDPLKLCNYMLPRLYGNYTGKCIKTKQPSVMFLANVIDGLAGWQVVGGGKEKVGQLHKMWQKNVYSKPQVYGTQCATGP